MFFFILSVIMVFLLPPVGLIMLAYYFFWKEPRDEKKDERTRRLRTINLSSILNSAPGPCPQCGKTNWQRGMLTLVPSGSFRMFEWPPNGTVSVARFTCQSCGSSGRWGISHERAEYGWMHLDRWSGGW